MPVPSVILLPGLACDAELFSEQLPTLQAAGHQVHVSDAHARFATLAQMAAALLVQHPGAHVWIGSSMGGMLALEVHRQAPQQVAGLVLLGSTARADTPELRKLRSDAVQLFEQGRADEVLRANVPFAFHPQAASLDRLVPRYLAMMRRAGAAQLAQQNRAVMARIDQRPHLGAIRCPLLVVCGDADLLTPPECAQEIAAALPQARLALLEQCGHMLTWEQPAALNALLLEWLPTFK